MNFVPARFLLSVAASTVIACAAPGASDGEPAAETTAELGTSQLRIFPSSDSRAGAFVAVGADTACNSHVLRVSTVHDPRSAPAGDTTAILWTCRATPGIGSATSVFAPANATSPVERDATLTDESRGTCSSTYDWA
jgi:hypothetical protein